jgi:hypothetical protein
MFGTHMNCGKLFVIFFHWSVSLEPLAVDFGSFRLRMSFGWSRLTSLVSSDFSNCLHFSLHVFSSHFSTCFAVTSWLTSVIQLRCNCGTCIMFLLALYFDLLPVWPFGFCSPFRTLVRLFAMSLTLDSGHKCSRWAYHLPGGWCIWWFFTRYTKPHCLGPAGLFCR